MLPNSTKLMLWLVFSLKDLLIMEDHSVPPGESVLQTESLPTNIVFKMPTKLKTPNSGLILNLILVTQIDIVMTEPKLTKALLS